MIAVFSKRRDFEDLHGTPKNYFIHITDIQSIRGRIFTGVIAAYGWYEDPKLRDAYDALQLRQPELFKK